jgi:hypothetical protein
MCQGNNDEISEQHDAQRRNEHVIRESLRMTVSFSGPFVKRKPFPQTIRFLINKKEQVSLCQGCLEVEGWSTLCSKFPQKYLLAEESPEADY